MERFETYHFCTYGDPFVFDLFESTSTVCSLKMYLFLLFLGISGISLFIKFCEDGHQKYEKWLNNISRIMDMDSISIKKHEMEIWQTLQTFLFSSKGIPSTPQHVDSHPCTTPPSILTASKINATKT